MKMYVVTANGYKSEYGAKIFLIGVFNNEQDAKEAKDQNGGRITEVDLNTSYPLTSVESWLNANGHYLGGYIE